MHSSVKRVTVCFKVASAFVLQDRKMNVVRAMRKDRRQRGATFPGAFKDGVKPRQTRPSLDGTHQYLVRRKMIELASKHRNPKLERKRNMKVGRKSTRREKKRRWTAHQATEMRKQLKWGSASKRERQQRYAGNYYSRQRKGRGWKRKWPNFTPWQLMNHTNADLAILVY